jgi:hypothetical protein
VWAEKLKALDDQTTVRSSSSDQAREISSSDQAHQIKLNTERTTSGTTARMMAGIRQVTTGYAIATMGKASSILVLGVNLAR